MFATGKYLKDKAAAARRAATTLRQLAESSEQSIQDRGVMLAAAQIVDGIANKTAKLGIERKASEEKRERDLKAAIAQAEKIVADLPAITTLEKVANVALVIRRLPILAEDIGDRPDAKRRLNYWVDDSRRDIVHDMASEHLRTKATLESIFETLRERFVRVQSDIVVINMAKRFDERIAAAEVAA